MNFNELQSIVNGSGNIVFFGGAGTSTESGIPDFRSAEGLYETGKGGKYPPEVMLSRDFFMEHTEEFYEFYKSKMIHRHAQPNPAHYALAELEKRGQLQAVITQNIDGLHTAAGSKNVLELHGSVHRNYCMDCRTAYTLEQMLESDSIVPHCTECGGVIKPDVTLYQEQLDMDVLERATTYIANADVLIVAGTSLTVQPAAGLVKYYDGDHFILINKTPTSFDRAANYVIHDSIAKVLQEFVR